jgi:hypothetical protein
MEAVQLPAGGPDTWERPLDVVKLATWVDAVSSANKSKGKVLEQFLMWLIPHISGLRVMKANSFSFGRASEIDLTVWNEQHEAGFRSFSPPILVECKNWEKPVGAADVAWFDWKLRLGGATHGLLVAANGITGNREEKNAAHQIIQHARSDGRTIVIMTLDELAGLLTSLDLRELIIDKVCDIAAAATQVSSGG